MRDKIMPIMFVCMPVFVYIHTHVRVTVSTVNARTYKIVWQDNV